MEQMINRETKLPCCHVGINEEFFYFLLVHKRLIYLSDTKDSVRILCLIIFCILTCPTINFIIFIAQN